MFEYPNVDSFFVKIQVVVATVHMSMIGCSQRSDDTFLQIRLRKGHIRCFRLQNRPTKFFYCCLNVLTMKAKILLLFFLAKFAGYVNNSPKNLYTEFYLFVCVTLTPGMFPILNNGNNLCQVIQFLKVFEGKVGFMDIKWNKMIVFANLIYHYLVYVYLKSFPFLGRN